MGKRNRNKGKKNKSIINKLSLTRKDIKMAIHSARVYGTVDPNLFDTTVVIEWGLDENLGSEFTLPIILADAGVTNVEYVMPELDANTLYYVQVTATNVDGEVKLPALLTFTTPSESPVGGAPILGVFGIDQIV